MIVSILLSQGGRFTLEIGDTDTNEIEAIGATRDLLKSEEVLFGVWGNANDHRKALGPQAPYDPHARALHGAYINPDYVAAVFAIEEIDA